GDERVRIEAPASTTDLERIEHALGGRRCPSELRRLLALTTEFDGSHPSFGTASLDFTRFEADAGNGLFLVVDYGNGDGLFLEPGEPTCRLWWLGHDSWFVALVARSIEEYVDRCASFLEACVRTDDADDADDEDTREE